MSGNFVSGLKLGILGGGQLGKMMVTAASQWDINTYVLDPTPDCPASSVCSLFVRGNFKEYDVVYEFGKTVDILTIEIEHVNTEALIQLKREGKIIHPDPERLKLIQDKGLQKQFYEQNNFPSPSFRIFENKEAVTKAIEDGVVPIPFVQKLRTAGYDGKGVAVIKNKEELFKLLDGACVIEDLVGIRKEISVIAARNPDGEVVVYPPVEMVFNPVVNLVEHQISPADLDPEISKEALDLATKMISTFKICGLLAVEMFLDENNQLLINEVAPRPHNSGHHTIESAFTSQYEQHLRAISNLPLGSTRLIIPSVMVNLLGDRGYSGPVKYTGLKDCMAVEGVKIHLYGKKETRPYRKMGHATILDADIRNAKKKGEFVLQTLKIQS